MDGVRAGRRHTKWWVAAVAASCHARVAATAAGAGVLRLAHQLDRQGWLGGPGHRGGSVGGRG
eukprot:scaffold87007_cov69-Phaeocystis_antarctica.AAC.1